MLDRTPVPGEGDEEPLGWIQIADGLIRWVRVAPDEPSNLWIPDSRIWLDYPHVSVQGIPVSSAIPFKRPKSVLWETDDPFYDLDEFKDGLDIPIGMTFSSQIADGLRDNTAVTEEILASRIHIWIETHLAQACWVIIINRELNRPIWDCCQAVAEALLEMPTPDQE